MPPVINRKKTIQCSHMTRLNKQCRHRIPLRIIEESKQLHHSKFTQEQQNELEPYVHSALCPVHFKEKIDSIRNLFPADMWIDNVDDIRFHERIAHGAFSQVFRAHYRHQVYAVKVTPLRSRNHFKSAFQELEVFAHIHDKQPSCPYIIRPLALAITNQNVYVLMDYCTGGQMYENSAIEAPCSLKKRMVICRQIAQALQFLHETCHVLFRDLKQENVLFNSKDKHSIAKLCDFGFAIVVTDPPSSKLKDMTGTPDYAAPESFKWDVCKTYKTDCWALGVMMYEMLHGIVPFHAEIKDDANTDNVWDTYEKVICEHKSPLPENFDVHCEQVEDPDPEIYHAWMDLVNACIEPNVDARLSMTDILKAFDVLLS